jgi:hypothetical protein
MLSASALYIVLYRENKARDRLQLNEEDKARMAFKDLTDKENKFFRYAL